MTVNKESAPSSVTVEQLLEQMRPCNELEDQRPAMPWLWHGYLAPGKVTLLTSEWKSGKTTLTAHLFARMANVRTRCRPRTLSDRSAAENSTTPATGRQCRERAGEALPHRKQCRPREEIHPRSSHAEPKPSPSAVFSFAERSANRSSNVTRSTVRGFSGIVRKSSAVSPGASLSCGGGRPRRPACEARGRHCARSRIAPPR
jgi:hypothetical protein